MAGSPLQGTQCNTFPNCAENIEVRHVWRHGNIGLGTVIECGQPITCELNASALNVKHSTKDIDNDGDGI